MSEDGVYAALYYAYSRCLPEDLIPDTANELLKAVHKMESTDAIVKEIKNFLAESDIKQGWFFGKVSGKFNTRLVFFCRQKPFIF